jgi:pimeloyl-ACP methyl ester carboxylesterase
VADLEVLREALGHATWWVGGHSWGAELALRYALAYPWPCPRGDLPVRDRDRR